MFQRGSCSAPPQRFFGSRPVLAFVVLSGQRPGPRVRCGLWRRDCCPSRRRCSQHPRSRSPRGSFSTTSTRTGNSTSGRAFGERGSHWDEYKCDGAGSAERDLDIARFVEGHQ
eukprot:1155837-Lingulodinium_polyedra.AAC.1